LRRQGGDLNAKEERIELVPRGGLSEKGIKEKRRAIKNYRLRNNVKELLRGGISRKSKREKDYRKRKL